MSRDDQRAPVVTGWTVVFDRCVTYQIRFLPAEIVVRLIGLARRALDVVLLHWTSVANELTFAHREGVARRANNALHLIEPRTDGIGEADQLPIPGARSAGK